jgi:AraC-like DNA-binding protein
MYATNNACLLRGLWTLLESYGIDPEPLFWEMAMDPEFMEQPGGRYRLDSIDKLWSKASEVIGDPCFGLKAAELWHPSYLSALGYAMLASNCLRTALERVLRYHRVLSDEEFMKLEETEEGLRYNLIFSHEWRDIPERSDAALAVTLSMCRLNYRADLAPVSVTLTHPKPICSAKFFEYFRSPVVFDAPTNSLTLPMDAVDKKLPGSNPLLAEINDQVMIKYLAELDQESITHKVQATIIDQLPSGNVTDESVAQDLHVSPRKLQRQLQSVGTTFNTLLNETRRDLARTYLRDHHHNMTEIAFLLGFSESSAFSRAFKRWLGVSPSEYRRVA